MAESMKSGKPRLRSPFVCIFCFYRCSTLSSAIDSALFSQALIRASCFALNSSLQAAGWWVVPSMRQMVREALA
jgi:hypothetical protein